MLRFILVGSITWAALTACSAKVDTPPAEDLFGKTQAFPHLVDGPKSDGRWISDCVIYRWDFDKRSYVIYDITMRGQSVRRVTTQFDDIYCTRRTSQREDLGLFRYAKSLANGVFEVEYRVRTKNIQTQFMENMTVDGAVMMISDHASGDAILPDIRLNLAP